MSDFAASLSVQVPERHPGQTNVVMANEVLAKLVCHNVVCCIHEAHERGIDVGFGPKPEADEKPSLIRFPGA